MNSRSPVPKTGALPNYATPRGGGPRPAPAGYPADQLAPEREWERRAGLGLGAGPRLIAPSASLFGRVYQPGQNRYPAGLCHGYATVVPRLCPVGSEAPNLAKRTWQNKLWERRACPPLPKNQAGRVGSFAKRKRVFHQKTRLPLPTRPDPCRVWARTRP